MNRIIKKTALFIVLILLFGCRSEQYKPLDYTICNLNMDVFDYSFGIDYDNPQQYLIPGEQSKVSDTWFDRFRDSIGYVPKNITGVLKVCNWIDTNFKKVNGRDIGNKTLAQLYAIRTLYDTHTTALAVSGTLRAYGFPTVMVETASVQWAYNFRAGDKRMFKVHVMVEVYVEDQWIILDNNCVFATDYDPLNPYIPAMNNELYPQGLMVYAKGRDSWEYGVRLEDDTRRKITSFALNLPCFEDLIGTAEYVWRN